jgi:riboflavin synthase
MFTGIITERGRVLDVVPDTANDATTLIFEAPRLSEGLDLGGSIAVNGVCLTATEIEGPRISAVVMGETLRLTTTGERKADDLVNLERCVTPGSHLDGHVVQGHVDGVGHLLSRTHEGAWDSLRFALPTSLARYVALKGAIAIDGVSLTVTGVSDPSEGVQWFEVGLIPATLEETGLGKLVEGGRVNLEVDVMAKYAERLMAFARLEDFGQTTTTTGRS